MPNGELRCDFKLHGIMVDDTTLEVKCSSSLCGAGNGITVLHYFDTRTGEWLQDQDKRFRDPQHININSRKEKSA